MKILILFLGLAISAYATPVFENEPDIRAPAVPCNATLCKLPNCQCSGTTIPGGLTAATTPQFVILTFDDAVTIANIDYYREALYNRKNPNTCPIAATLFVAHEYTDYSLIHELHAHGQEIALHSITHEPLTTYWKDATVETLTSEFAGERTLIANFANISAADIKGIRMPFLQMAGNNQFEMLKTNNFAYDLSWPTQSYMTPGLWPYTTEYKSIQDCVIAPCPDQSYSNVWVIPMINWVDYSNNVCAMIDACVDIPNTTNALVDWMKREFNKQYTGNKAPIGFYTHAAWFTADPADKVYRFEAYKKFIDYLQTLKDVYIVSASQVIDWVKAPKTIAQMNTTPGCQKTYTPTCTARACQLMKEETIERWLTSCISQCPNKYPWLRNPLGN